MDKIVDIYMPDFKFWDGKMARRYVRAPNYPETARRAIREMHRQIGTLVIDQRSLALHGLILRHLVMPGSIAGTREILQWVARELGPDTYVNVMSQYFPAGKVSANEHAEINRNITSREFQEALDAAHEAGLRRLDPRAP